MKSIGIIGCGWLGSRLAKRLSGKFNIYVTTRKEENLEELKALGYNVTRADFSESEESVEETWEKISSIDTLVISVPFSTRSNPALIEQKMNNLIKFIGDFKGQMFFMSSTGVYPKDEKKVFKESDLSPAENAIESQIKRQYSQINILRLGGLMGDNRLLSNYKVSNPEDPVNHVHYYDVCSVIIQIMDSGVDNKLYNVVAPMHPSKKDVIDSQINASSENSPDAVGRIISSAKLIRELEFDFRYPDPKWFHG